MHNICQQQLTGKKLSELMVLLQLLNSIVSHEKMLGDTTVRVNNGAGHGNADKETGIFCQCSNTKNKQHPNSSKISHSFDTSYIYKYALSSAWI